MSGDPIDTTHGSRTEEEGANDGDGMKSLANTFSDVDLDDPRPQVVSEAHSSRSNEDAAKGEQGEDNNSASPLHHTVSHTVESEEDGTEALPAAPSPTPIALPDLPANKQALRQAKELRSGHPSDDAAIWDEMASEGLSTDDQYCKEKALNSFPDDQSDSSSQADQPFSEHLDSPFYGNVEGSGIEDAQTREDLDGVTIPQSSLFADLGDQATDSDSARNSSSFSPSHISSIVAGPTARTRDARTDLYDDASSSSSPSRHVASLHAANDVPPPPLPVSGTEQGTPETLSTTQQEEQQAATPSPPPTPPTTSSATDQIRSVFQKFGLRSHQVPVEQRSTAQQAPELPRSTFRRWGQQATDTPSRQDPGEQDGVKLVEQIRNAAAASTTAGAASSRQRSPQYAYPAHSDSDTLTKEIEEFYSYVETPQILENRQSWERWLLTEDGKASVVYDHIAGDKGVEEEAMPLSSISWTSLPSSLRQRHIRSLLSQLTCQDPDKRLIASRAFLYLLQGSFAETNSAEHQEHWIQLNAKLSREAGAISKVYEALKKALWKHDFLTSLPDYVQGSHDGRAGEAGTASGMAPLLTPQSKADYLDEVNLELTLSFAQMYMLIETGRRSNDEGNDADRLPDDLMDLEPPLPIYLWLVVAGLREKSAKGFPVKKLLLCLWKTLLTCLGGQRDVERCKALARRVEGLPPAPAPSTNAHWPPTPHNERSSRQSRSSSEPEDHGVTPNVTSTERLSSSTMERDMSDPNQLPLGKPRQRRPTKATPKDFEVFRDELAVKYPTYLPPRRTPADLPIEKLASALEPVAPRRLTFASGENNASFEPRVEGGEGAPGPATPAPSPPPSPRPNKQKYQTDQSRPFVFPFAASVQGDRMVPYSIEEADRLYAENMYVSSEMWQMWRTREELSREEKGLASEKQQSKSVSSTQRRGTDNKRDGTASRPSARSGSGLHLARSLLSSPNNAIAQYASSSEGAPSRSSSHDGRGWAGLQALAFSRLDVPQVNAGADTPSRLTSTSPPAFTPGGGSPRLTAGAISEAGSSEEYPGAVAPVPIDPEKSFLTRGEPTYHRLIEVEAEVQETLAKAEGDHLLAVFDNDRYLKNVSLLQQQVADVRRLQRVDLLYNAVVNNLQSAVVVLLKLLLATVTAPNGPLAADANPEVPPPPPTVEDVDILRHREITTKAVSAILLLSLKWFKASHAMKFHHLGQFLVDSNAMLLILKMFGLQEVANSIRAVNEDSGYNFFSFCEAYGLKDPSDLDIGSGLSLPAVKPVPGSANGLANAPVDTSMSVGADTSMSQPTVDESGLIHEYSCRNFFSIINFTRILQKVTKRKVHRILLLVQYKSSAILKRSLKVPHPALQLYVLKVIKSQVPFCGRKWRQSNMKVITGIYLNCRPELRDEWLSSDKDSEIYESLIQEQALRSLVKFYISSRFGGESEQNQQQQGTRTQPPRRAVQSGWDPSPAEQALSDGPFAGEQEGPGSEQGVDANVAPTQPQRWGFFEANLFLQPLKRGGGNPGGAEGPGAAAYIPDDIVEGYLGDYDEILNEVFGTSTTDEHFYRDGGRGIADTRRSLDAELSTAVSQDMSPSSPSSSASASPTPGSGNGMGPGGGLTSQGARQAWEALGEILGQNDDSTSSASDSDSIASIGELNFPHPHGTIGVADSGANGLSDQRLPTLDGNSSMTLAEEEGKSNWEDLSPREMRFLSSTAAAGKLHRDRSRSPSPSHRTLGGGGGVGTTLGSLGSPTNALGTGRLIQSSPSSSPRSGFSSNQSFGGIPGMAISSFATNGVQPREIRPMPLARRSSSSSHTPTSLTSSSPGLLQRAYSDSQPLRPVLDFEAMDLEVARRAARAARGSSGGAADDDDEDEEDVELDDDEGVLGPISPNKVGGIDEVEHIFGQ